MTTGNTTPSTSYTRGHHRFVDRGRPRGERRWGRASERGDSDNLSTATSTTLVIGRTSRSIGSHQSALGHRSPDESRPMDTRGGDKDIDRIHVDVDAQSQR